jgi:AcrR family transcriptional regulator
MRVLADELGTSPMSLYRHVRNKEDLLDGINHLAFAGLDLEIPTTGDWQDRVLAWMHAMRSELHAHPVVAPLLRLSGSLAPSLLRALDKLLQILLEAGFEGREAVLACREVMWFAMGFVTNEIRIQETRGPSSSSPRTHDLGSFARISPADAAGYPALAGLMPHFVESDLDEVFAAGTHHILWGLERELAAKSARGEP